MRVRATAPRGRAAGRWGRAAAVVAGLVAAAVVGGCGQAVAASGMAVAGPVPSSSPTPVAPTAPTEAPTPDPHAGEPWWVRAGLDGQRVDAVAVTAAGVVVSSGGRRLRTADAGATFSPASPNAAPPAAEAVAGADRWVLSGGRVLHGTAAAPLAADALAPDLGAGAHLIAAPATAPGLVVAVSDAGVVWRRDPAGEWSRSLILLPRTPSLSRPAITSLAAFAEPVSSSVYLGTDGYSVLLTGDGVGWLRAGPGLPDHVLGLAADSAQRVVWAATDDGLYVHHLRTLPSVPSYRDADLTIRRIGTIAVTALGLAIAAGVLALLRPGRRRRARVGDALATGGGAADAP